MVMQSVPTQRSTNRLIRGNRTCVQKRHGSYSFIQDQSQGLDHGFPRREKVFRSGNGFEDTCECRLEIGIDAGLRFYLWDRQELISAVGITGIPGSKCKETFFDEFLASTAQLVLMKYGHCSFDNVESPTREPVLVGNECEKEVECKFFGLEVCDPLLGSKSMVKPRKMARDLPYAVWDNGHEWFFHWHDSNSKWLLKCLFSSNAHDIVCCMRNRLLGIDVARKPKKLESFQLAKPSDLCHLYFPAKLPQCKKFAEIAETEVDSKKNIQQINKFRREEDSKLLSL